MKIPIEMEFERKTWKPIRIVEAEISDNAITDLLIPVYLAAFRRGDFDEVIIKSREDG